MTSLDINMLFWTDDVLNSTRDRNAKFSVKELKNLSEYLLSRDINCTYKVYDYSKKQILEDSIHIPYPSSAFKKSEKINNILKKTNSELFSIIDSDCFICREDYKLLADIINQMSANSCATFDVLDFCKEDTEKIIYDNISPLSLLTKTTARFEGRAGGLGAFFITDANDLKLRGGFNEKFTTWGGEDGEIYNKIHEDKNIKKFIIKNDTIRLFHLNHFLDRENINYYNAEEYISNNY
jgi:hypothetical protein